MYILSRTQIQAADAFTIQQQQISSTQLMDRVAQLLFNRMYPLCSQGTTHIFCGTGNNGGDGLALGRLLHQAGIEVKLYAVGDASKGSRDYLVQYERAQQAGMQIQDLHSIGDIPTPIQHPHLIVDALLGSGTNRTVQGFLKDLIEWLNKQKAARYAIDIPSGMMADASDTETLVAVYATRTFTLACYKLSSMLSSNYLYYGNVELIDIGWPSEVWTRYISPYYFLETADVVARYHPRQAHVSKHDLGFAQLFVGSKGKAGAAMLTAGACLRSGCGLTEVTVPASLEFMIQLAAPEAMCSCDSSSDVHTEFVIQPRATALGVGPGVGYDERTKQGFARFIKNNSLPIVVDADALNMISDDLSLLYFLGGKAILTPHVREFDRIFGTSKNEWERLQLAQQQAIKYEVVLILKGMITAIVLPSGEVYFSKFGNACLAKGGSGDVLTGILTSLLASGYSLGNAAMLGVYLLGCSAEKSVQNNAMESVVASEIIENIGQAYLSLQEKMRLGKIE